jgi:Protein of unknown function (DUF3014)
MQSRTIVIIAVVVVVVVIGGIWWWQRPQPMPEVPPPAPPPVTQPAPRYDDLEVPATPAVQQPELPPLNDSDTFVRAEIAPVADPQLSQWLEQEDLVRRFAVVIDNAAGGEYPRRQLGFLAPAGKFSVLEQNDRIIVDPQSYDRYDPFVDAVVSVEPQRAAALLKELAPLLTQAMQELGETDPDPLTAVKKGIAVALATPVTEGDVELVQPKVFYLYADPKLESLRPLQKQLLRMGPHNVERLKAYLTQVNALL